MATVAEYSIHKIVYNNQALYSFTTDGLSISALTVVLGIFYFKFFEFILPLTQCGGQR